MQSQETQQEKLNLFEIIGQKQVQIELLQNQLRILQNRIEELTEEHQENAS